MITRKLLIVHQSKVVRTMIKGFVLAELDDVTPLEAKSGQEVDEILTQEKVHIVLCALYLKDCDGYDIHRKLQSSEATRRIRFILFTSTDSESQVREIQSQKISHYLVTPFTSSELRDSINRAYNPRKLRRQQRYNIPGTKAVLHFDNQEVESEVINLSLSSIFCEIDIPEGQSQLLDSKYISIKFPFDLDDITINDIFCKVLSVKTISWNFKDEPEKVRAVLLFKELPEKKEEIYAAILERVEERNQKLAEMH